MYWRMVYRNLIPESLLLLVAISCGGGGIGGGGNSSSGSMVPTNLTATAVEYSSFQVSWNAPPAPVDAYDLQVKIGSGPFEGYYNPLLPSTITSVYLNYSSAVPELTEFWFRVRASRGSSFSDFSNEVHTKIGLIPPSIASTLYNSQIYLSWSNRSSLTESILVERNEVDATGTVLRTTSIGTFPLSITKFVDSDLQEGKIYQYRAKAVRSPDESIFDKSFPITVSVLGPNNLHADARTDGIRLTWTNRSAKATALRVLRASGIDDSPSTLVSTLPTNASEFTDPVPSAGYYSYCVEAVSPSESMRSQPSYAATLPAGPSFPAGAEFLRLPSGDGMARDSKGMWYAAVKSGTALSILSQKATGWDSHALTDAWQFISPAVKLDSSGNPHCVYLRGPYEPGVGYWITHEWFDGSAWRYEKIAQRTVAWGASSDPSWVLSPQGTVHVLWKLGSSNPEAFEHATKVGGAWAISNLTAPIIPTFGVQQFKLVASSSETAYILLMYFNKMLLLNKASGSNWLSEQVPLGSVPLNGTEGAGLAVNSSGEVTIMLGSTYVHPGFTVLQLSRGASGWNSPEEIFSLSGNSSVWQFQFLESGDGTTLQVAFSLNVDSSSMAQFYLKKVLSLGWKSTRILPGINGKFFMDLDSAGKGYLLLPVNTSDPRDDSQVFALYTETP